MQRRLLGQLRTVNMRAMPYGWLSSEAGTPKSSRTCETEPVIQPQSAYLSCYGKFPGAGTKESGLQLCHDIKSLLREFTYEAHSGQQQDDMDTLHASHPSDCFIAKSTEYACWERNVCIT